MDMYNAEEQVPTRPGVQSQDRERPRVDVVCTGRTSELFNASDRLGRDILSRQRDNK
jgi:hypothetical protein